MDTTATGFDARRSEYIATAAAGTPVEVSKRGAPHVAIVSAEEYRSLGHAEAALHGFLRLAARGAECWEYQERAEDLMKLVRSGALNVPSDLEVTAPSTA